MAELFLGLGTQCVAAGGPEVGDGCADRGVLARGELIHVAGVCNLAFGGRVDAMDFARRQILEEGHAELLGYCVYSRVLEELDARVVDLGERRVRLECPLAGAFLGEVLAGIEELEEAADGVDVLVTEVDLTGLDKGRTG